MNTTWEFSLNRIVVDTVRPILKIRTDIPYRKILVIEFLVMDSFCLMSLTIVKEARDIYCQRRISFRRYTSLKTFFSSIILLQGLV